MLKPLINNPTPLLSVIAAQTALHGGLPLASQPSQRSSPLHCCKTAPKQKELLQDTYSAVWWSKIDMHHKDWV